MISISARGSVRRWLVASLVCTTVVGFACEGNQPNRAAEGAAAARLTMPALVGYDFRRIRPQQGSLDQLFERLTTEARDDGKRLALLFTADWCDACRKLELEFGNSHPAGTIDDVRILQFVEEDWEAATRMDEVYELRSRYYPRLDNYPVMVLLDRAGRKIEEMQEASKRLEEAGQEPSMVNWFAGTRPTEDGASNAATAPASP